MNRKRSGPRGFANKKRNKYTDSNTDSDTDSDHDSDTDSDHDSNHDTDSDTDSDDHKKRKRQQGQTGPTGESGMTGPTGMKGIQGIQGVTGPTGERGERGMKGPIGMIGPQGSTGPQGTQGLTGPQGTQGLTGPQGTQGSTGPQGTQRGVNFWTVSFGGKTDALKRLLRVNGSSQDLLTKTSISSTSSPDPEIEACSLYSSTRLTVSWVIAPNPTSFKTILRIFKRSGTLPQSPILLKSINPTRNGVESSIPVTVNKGDLINVTLTVGVFPPPTMQINVILNFT